MKTITFYSYKGGTGRSLALANAARYLARLEFKVVALDFDLEAPGLHYKFSSSVDAAPIPVQEGIVDYLHTFIVEGKIPKSIKTFALDVNVPGTNKPLVRLMAAGSAPSKEYWLKLSRINWHELFYSKGSMGVQVFLELKNRIKDELAPDFLLIDSRTGITEMGGVATTLLADKVICLVLPTRENLEGARAVLRSLKKSRREFEAVEPEIIVALSRLPQQKDSQGERELTDYIRDLLNEEAEALEDTLSCSEVFVLHSEASLEIRESLRVGSGVSPDDSILLRDYLRLFSNVVPSELIEPKVGKLIQQAKEKIWEDPEAALKEVEELAESFGHPETYRALLRFYEVRNATGISVLRRAQRLWELTRNSSDIVLWQILKKVFEPSSRLHRDREWSPNLDFVEAVWRDAGGKDANFGMKLAEALEKVDHESHAADVLIETIRSSEPNAGTLARTIPLLDGSERVKEADRLIEEFKSKFVSDPNFVEAWSRHALKDKSDNGIAQILQSPVIEVLTRTNPILAGKLYVRAGLSDEATTLAVAALRELPHGSSSFKDMFELGELFHALGQFEDFEKMAGPNLPSYVIDQLRDHLKIRRRRR